MAAMATKKPNGDRGVQLTFPMNFQAAFNGGIGYFPNEYGPPMELMLGKAFQSEYHEEKRAYANQSVMNGIQNKRSAERKLLTGPHNYHLPKPVLGQRRFANPSVGALSFSSSRRDQIGSPWTTIEAVDDLDMGTELRGGVVTSREGYDFYKQQLNNRIGELNNINAVAQGFSVPAGQSMATYDNTKNGPISKINLFIYIRALGDSVVEGDLSRFSFENLKEMITMMATFVPSATNDDINDMMDECDTMLESLRAYEPDVAETTDKQEYAATLKMYLEKINNYLDEMLRNINMSPMDKQTLSRSLMVSLKFDKLIKKDLAGVIRDARSFGPRFAQEAEDLDDGDADGRFDEEAPVREDEDHGNTDRQPLAGNNGDPERERFGNRNGSIAQSARGYFGEGDAYVDATGDGIVAPLDDAGVDPNAVAPTANLSPIVDALKAVVTKVLEDLLTEDDRTRTLQESVNAHYPEGPEQFVGEVLQGMEDKGYSPVQVSAAISVSDPQIRTILEPYFDAPTDLGAPARAEPAVRIQGTPVALPPAASAPAAPASRNLIDSYPEEIATLAALGIPAYRTELRQQATTIARVRQLAENLRQVNTYRPRDGTAVKVAVAELIRRIQNIAHHF
jgi:hypothetical protein